jgi:uncharacterized protein DUF4115
MAGQNDQPQPPQASNTPVPDLIERYRLRRDAWIAQADELARLRDEVRSSAEREAMEIVTAARRDVRKVIMEARRELLVLSAQVQAALGESNGKTDPALLLNKAGITSESTVRALTGSTDVFAPEDAVNEILNEVHGDMTALAEDAKALPLKAVPPVRQIGSSSTAPPPLASGSPLRAPQISVAPPVTPSSPRPSAPPPDVASVIAAIPEPVISPLDDVHDLDELMPPVVLSSQFPSDAVPVPVTKRLGAFLGVFVGIGVLVVGVTVWWLMHRTTETSESASTAPAATSSRPSASRPTEPSSAQSKATPKVTTPAANSANLSVVGEAVRQVWVKTTIDGRSDNGRTLVAGQVIDVSADQTISLQVGDAGAILVSVNKGEKRPLGRDGQVVTRQFAAEKSENPRPIPNPVPATPAPPERPAPTRPAPPIASAAPAVAQPVRTPPPSSQAPNTAGGVGTLLPTAPTPTPAPAPTPTVNQLAATPPPQPTVPAPANPLSALPPPVPSPNANPGGSPASVVVAVARQWLDAYHRQDRAAMAALSTENLLLADERRADERFPAGLSDVTRTLDKVSVQIAADTAVLTAVMMEQSGSVPSPHVSPISQVWVLGAGQWKVRQARFVSEARLNQVFR